VISSARGLVILLACIFVLPPMLGMTGVWLAAPVTEGLTLILSLVFIRRQQRSPIKGKTFDIKGVE
jgi:Na+-driven multidrug efflux pump